MRIIVKYIDAYEGINNPDPETYTVVHTRHDGDRLYLTNSMIAEEDLPKGEVNKIIFVGEDESGVTWYTGAGINALKVQKMPSGPSKASLVNLKHVPRWVRHRLLGIEKASHEVRERVDKFYESLP